MNKFNRFIVSHYLMDHDSGSNEVLLLEPDTQTIKGDILFFHGHQVGVRTGAWETPRYLAPLIKHGYRVIVPSILGYGRTTGEADYCGSNTLQRLEDTVRSFITKPVHVIGASRGGTLAVLFAEHFPEQTQSCTAIAGTYDLESILSETSDDKMRQNILDETGGTLDAYNARNPRTLSDRIKAPLHIVHGEKDEQIPVTQATEFNNFLISKGFNPKLSILENENHKLFSERTFNDVIVPFIEKI